MLSYPKRNIAQPAPKRKKKRAEVVISSPELPEELESKPNCPGAIWTDMLYPSELWRLHSDLDKITYQHGSMSEKETREVSERIPFSLLRAEEEADKKLFDFVQDSLNTVGVEKYSEMLKRAMTPGAQMLLALRCYAAATSGHRIRDTVTIFSNRQMNSLDFFPGSCRGSMIDPRTGKPSPFVMDRPDAHDDNPYWRAQNHSSGKHRMVRQITTDPKSTRRDKMPPSLAGQMSGLLSGFGINVKSHEDAWLALSERSRMASIEDRVVARIAYLIMNATIHKDNQLGGHSQKLLP